MELQTIWRVYRDVCRCWGMTLTPPRSSSSQEVCIVCSLQLGLEPAKLGEQDIIYLRLSGELLSYIRPLFKPTYLYYLYTKIITFYKSLVFKHVKSLLPVSPRH